MTEAMFKLIVPEPADLPPDRVYLDYYHLTEAPFSITPDPEFLFSSSCHKQVLDRISYAIDGYMGFILLTGEVGTGKTTICRTLLDQLSEKAETVYVINPSVSGHELLVNILEDMGAHPEPQANKKNLIDQLNRHLLSKPPGHSFVVIIDDAQTMTSETLEDLRLLSNLETDKRKLIQVVLSGQPELLDMLADERLRQLKQRIAVHCRLEPLPVRETGEYISRRLFVAGNQGQVGFSPPAARLVHKTSGGIPRLINKICDFSLTAGYVNDAQAIEPVHVKRALSELEELDCRAARIGRRASRYAWPAVIFLMVVVSAVFFTFRPGKAVLTSSAQMEEPFGVFASPEPLHADATITAGWPLSDTPSPATAHLGFGKHTVDTVIAATRPDTPRAEGVDQTGDRRHPAPYALQLGSFRTLARAERSAAKYRGKGLPAFWQRLENGQWYRIVTGKFINWKQADQFRREHGLPDALIIQAPLSVKVLLRQPGLSHIEIIRFLKEIGYDSLMETGITGDNEVYTGLFLSLEDAATTAERINASDRFLAQVVSRRTAQRHQE